MLSPNMRGMSVELCILASGSSGNCSVVRSPAGVMLIDAGIGPRTCARRLDGTGVRLGEIRAICLTHLDHDHFSPTWAATLVKLQIRVYCHADVRDGLLARSDDPALRELVHPFDGRAFEPLEGLRFHAIRLAHDAEGSHGFLAEGFGVRLGYATDLGRVPGELLERFCDLDLLAIESNYDPDMQLSSARPWFLKQRIMGGRGHLSNQQALEAVQQILDRCQQTGRLPRHIVLLHRSRQCNCPRLLHDLFTRDPRIAPRLTLTDQHTRTPWLKIVDRAPLVGEQLMLM
jgi:phosphoribosyl 1,2-cyclic phosphodiesterase